MLEATVSRLDSMIPSSRVLVITNEETSRAEGFRILESYEKTLERSYVGEDDIERFDDQYGRPTLEMETK